MEGAEDVAPNGAVDWPGVIGVLSRQRSARGGLVATGAREPPRGWQATRLQSLNPHGTAMFTLRWGAQQGFGCSSCTSTTPGSGSGLSSAHSGSSVRQVFPGNTFPSMIAKSLPSGGTVSPHFQCRASSHAVDWRGHAGRVVVARGGTQAVWCSTTSYMPSVPTPSTNGAILLSCSS